MEISRMRGTTREALASTKVRFPCSKSGLLLEEEQWQEALHTFQKIESLDEDNSLIQTHLGMVRHLLNRMMRPETLERPCLPRKITYGPFCLGFSWKTTEKKRWLGKPQEVELILDDLLYRRFERGWEKIKHLAWIP